MSDIRQAPPDPVMIRVPTGAYHALAWFFQNSKDAFVALHEESVRRANDAWSALVERQPAANDASFWEFVAPEDHARVKGPFRGLTHGRSFECEFRLATRHEVWVRAEFVGGEAGWVLAIVRDVTPEKRLRESEARFRGLVNATSDVVYRMSPDWREMRQLDGRGFIADTDAPSVAWIDEYLLPEDQPRVLAAIETAIAIKDVFQLEHRIRRVDGSVGWTLSRAVPLIDERGDIIEWFGAASDITERRRSEEQLKLVVHELNHRVKNNIAMIQAAASQAFRGAGSLAEAEQSLDARIRALAHAADLLTGEAWSGPSIREVVCDAAGPHCGAEDRLEIEGPEVELTPRRAHMLSLAVHELATNAVKYGAWSAEGGRVVVTWSSLGEGSTRRLHLEWREHGGPPVAPPGRLGFGSRLIERGLAAEFEGAAKLRFELAGLVCVLDAPLAA